MSKKKIIPRNINQGSIWRVYKIHSNLGKETPYVSRFDWAEFPKDQLTILQSLGRLVVDTSQETFKSFYFGLVWIYRFIQEREHYAGTTLLDFDEFEWGAFCAWLENQNSRSGRPLALTTRRSYMVAIKLALELAALRRILGVTYEHVDELVRGTRRRFRDTNFLSAQRAADRAWTDEERDNLLSILREEWLSWKEWKDASEHGEIVDENLPDLLVTMAAYLAWEETVRPEELNVMTVDDIDFTEKNRIFMHAPNKTEGWIEVDAISKTLIRAVIEWGSEARVQLNNRRLLVEPLPSARNVGSTQLNFRLRLLLDKYKDKYPLDRSDVIFADGRKTLGSLLAGKTTDRELVRMTMRHSQQSTMLVYYVRQGKAQLSKNIEKSLSSYATRLSMAYNRAVVDPMTELPPEQIDILQRNPNHSVPYGACTRDTMKEGECFEGIHCGDCKKLIPMATKLGNFIAERDLVLDKAKLASEERTKENLLAHAAMLEGHIMNIQRRLQEGKGVRR